MQDVRLVNAYDIPTSAGYKSIELYQADICNFPKPLDCLVFSAFEDSYIPMPGTVIKSIEDNYGLNVQFLSENPSIDLRREFNVWLSKKINDRVKRLACVEMNMFQAHERPVSLVIKNLFALFAVMDQLERPIQSVALPVMGTGRQGIAVEQIIPSMIEESIKGLEKIKQLRTIYIVGLSKEKMSIYDSAMNSYLNRDRSDINDVYANKYYKAIIKELESNLQTIVELQPTEPIVELNRKLVSKNLRTFELGILSRRICEEIVLSILDDKKALLERGLAESITALHRKGIANWMISYFHTIRIFGNYYAHSILKDTVFPSRQHEQDVLVLISSLNRVLIFYLEWNRHLGLSHQIVKTKIKD